MTGEVPGLSVPKPSAEPPAPGEPWTVLRMVLWSAEYLEGKGVDRGRLDAEYLLAHVLDLDRLQLYLQFDRPLTPDELSAYRPLLKRRASREPLQYVLGTAAFRELDLQVDPRVLIPRPETEGLVEQVLAWAGHREGPFSALDVGTGSGAIAISLVTEGPCSRCVATDASSEALAVASANARSAGATIDFRHGSLFEPLAAGERFDVVVSNPPYVLESERADLAPEVLSHEPASALFAGSDGLDVVRQLIGGAADVVAPGGLLALEIGADQGAAVLRLASEAEGFGPARLYPDLSSRDRYVMMTRTQD